MDGLARWGMVMEHAARQGLVEELEGVKDAAETIFGEGQAETEVAVEEEVAAYKSGRTNSEDTIAGCQGGVAGNTGAKGIVIGDRLRRAASGQSRAAGTGTSIAVVSFRTPGFSAKRSEVVPHPDSESQEQYPSFHLASLARCS